MLDKQTFTSSRLVEPPSYRGAVLLFAVAATGVFLLLSSNIAVWGSTEARELHVATVMKSGHDWILPLRNGVVPSKPPLFHWCTVTLGSFYGEITPTVGRSVSFLSGAALLAGLFLSVSRRNKKPKTAFLAFALLASTPMFVRLAIDARVDMLFALCVFVAYAVSAPTGKAISWTFYVSIAAAILAKGPLGIVLPLLLGAGRAFWLSELRSWIKRVATPSIAMCALVVPLVWYVLALAKGGAEFLWRVGFENLDRFFQSDPERQVGAASYLDAIFVKAAPWSWLFCLFVFADCRRIYLKRPRTRRQADAAAVLLCLTFFLASTGKRDAYLLPLLPLMMTYVAQSLAGASCVKASLSRVLSSSLSCRSIDVLIACMAICFSVSLVIPVAYSKHLLFSPIVESIRVEHLFALIVVWTSFRLLHSGRRFPNALLAFSVVMLFGYMLGLGMKSALRNFSEVAVAVETLAENSAGITVVKRNREEYFDPLEYYLQCSVAHLEPGKELNDGQLYVSRAAYLDLIPRPIEILRRIPLEADRLRDRRDRDFIVFIKGKSK